MIDSNVILKYTNISHKQLNERIMDLSRKYKVMSDVKRVKVKNENGRPRIDYWLSRQQLFFVIAKLRNNTKLLERFVFGIGKEE